MVEMQIVFKVLFIVCPLLYCIMCIVDIISFQCNFSLHSELYLSSSVPVVDSPISALEFYRDWVTPNLPVLIKGAVNNWPAIRKWNVQFLRYSFGLFLLMI